MRFCIFIFLLGMLCSCNGQTTNKAATDNQENAATCDTLKLLEDCFKQQNKDLSCLSNFNNYIASLEKETNIESQATKDIDGYHYPNEAQFYEDLKKWKKFLGCK